MLSKSWFIYLLLKGATKFPVPTTLFPLPSIIFPCPSTIFDPSSFPELIIFPEPLIKLP